MEDGRVKMEEKENQLDLRWWALGKGGRCSLHSETYLQEKPNRVVRSYAKARPFRCPRYPAPCYGPGDRVGRGKKEEGRVKMEEKENQLGLRRWSLGA